MKISKSRRLIETALCDQWRMAGAHSASDAEQSSGFEFTPDDGLVGWVTATMCRGHLARYTTTLRRRLFVRSRSERYRLTGRTMFRWLNYAARRGRRCAPFGVDLALWDWGPGGGHRFTKCSAGGAATGIEILNPASDRARDDDLSLPARRPRRRRCLRTWYEGARARRSAVRSVRQHDSVAEQTIWQSHHVGRRNGSHRGRFQFDQQ